MTRGLAMFVRGVMAMGAVLTLIAAAALAVDLVHQRVAPLRLTHFDLEEARVLLHTYSRACNQIMGVVFTTVAIAVPLTANMYSLKFLEYFVKDRVNAAVLSMVVFGALNVVVIGSAMKQGFIPRFALELQFVHVTLTFSLIFPYLYYVFRFLHPNTLLARLEAEVRQHLARVAAGSREVALHRRELAEALEHVANVAVRSVDRLDRNTAIESVLVLERAAIGYWADKARLPDAWFDVEEQQFLWLPQDAVAEATLSRSWVETKILVQLGEIMSAAVPKAHDTVSTCAKVLRRLGGEPVVLADPVLRELVVEYFNTFIRIAITRRDPRSVFIVLDQYRSLADALTLTHPAEALEVAFYLQYYGRIARETGLPFVVEAVAHDLGGMVRHAFAVGAPHRHELLERLVAYDAGQPPLQGVKKAQAILASSLLSAGERDSAARLATAFASTPRALVERIRDELGSVKRQKYWEVNERRLNIEWVPDDQRASLREFLDGVLAAHEG